MNAEELLAVSRDSYNKWFERWYPKQNLPEKLKQSAMQGYTGLTLRVNDEYYSEYTQRRMRDDAFIGKLQGELNGLKVTRMDPVRYERKLLGRNLGHGYTDFKISITW